MNWYKRAKAKYAQRGEFWITGSGDVMEASGDGDYNHEGYVIDMLARGIIEDSDIQSHAEGEYIDWDGWVQEMEQYLMREKAALGTPIPEGDEYDAVMQDILDNGHAQEEIDLVVGRGDAREYAMKNWGWKRLEGTNIETWNLSDKDLSAINSGLYDAYGEIDPATEISIWVASSKKWFTSTMQEMEENISSEIMSPSVHPQMGQAMENAFKAQDTPANSYYKDWN